MRIISMIIILMFFVRVAYAIPYVERGNLGGFEHGGYSDEVVDSHTAVIKFQGTSSNSPQELQSYLLRHCAEVTMENGYRYFTIMSTTTSAVNVDVDSEQETRQVYPPTRAGNDTYTTDVAKSAHVSRTKTPYCEDKTCATTVTAVIDMFNNASGSRMPRTYSVYDIIGHEDE
jgi:hypothetical protein